MTTAILNPEATLHEYRKTQVSPYLNCIESQLFKKEKTILVFTSTVPVFYMIACQLNNQHRVKSFFCFKLQQVYLAFLAIGDLISEVLSY